MSVKTYFYCNIKTREMLTKQIIIPILFVLIWRKKINIFKRLSYKARGCKGEIWLFVCLWSKIRFRMNYFSLRQVLWPMTIGDLDDVSTPSTGALHANKGSGHKRRFGDGHEITGRQETRTRQTPFVESTRRNRRRKPRTVLGERIARRRGYRSRHLHGQRINARESHGRRRTVRHTRPLTVRIVRFSIVAVLFFSFLVVLLVCLCPLLLFRPIPDLSPRV